MPYKKGPNGTLRAYCSRNGRYTKMTPEQMMQQLFAVSSKRKKSNAEKEQERIGNILNRARHSKDEYLYELCLYIEDCRPGVLRHTNIHLYDKQLHSTREVDIVTARSLIEVKSKTGKHALKQFLAQKKLSESLGKRYYVFAPNMSDARFDEYSRWGIPVIRTKEKLIEGDL